jgi:hypothetical protein
MEQQDMHISAHIMHILPHMDEPRIIMPIVIWHMAAQSSSMHVISDVMPSILLQHIIISMHIDMHMPQSSIHRHIEFMSIFIMSIEFPRFSLVDFGPWTGQLASASTSFNRRMLKATEMRNQCAIKNKCV